MTGCRKQLPEVESRKEKVRGWGDGELPFPPPLTCPTCPWCHWQWLYPVPASGSVPKGSVGSRGWMCPLPLALAAPSLCRHPTGLPGTGWGRDSAPQGAWSRGAALGVASPATSVLT